MYLPLLEAMPDKPVQEITDLLAKKRVVALTGVAESLAPCLASLFSQRLGIKTMLVYANDLKASRAAEDARTYLGANVAFLPAAEIDLTRGTSSQDSTWRRLDTLNQLADHQVRLLCISADALIQRMGFPEPFRDRTLHLRTALRLAPQQLMDQLVMAGYERVSLVEGRGQCALRGSILDVYPPSLHQAVRIEYFDDEIDSIRLFDPLSQRSMDKLEEVDIQPA